MYKWQAMWETTFPRNTHAGFCKDFTTVSYTKWHVGFVHLLTKSGVGISRKCCFPHGWQEAYDGHSIKAKMIWEIRFARLYVMEDRVASLQSSRRTWTVPLCALVWWTLRSCTTRPSTHPRGFYNSALILSSHVSNTTVYAQALPPIDDVPTDDAPTDDVVDDDAWFVAQLLLGRTGRHSQRFVS